MHYKTSFMNLDFCLQILIEYVLEKKVGNYDDTFVSFFSPKFTKV